MFHFALRVLKELASCCLAVIPCIVVFYTESSSSLQFWKAVQRIPLRDNDEGGSNSGMGNYDVKKSCCSKLLNLKIVGIASRAILLTTLYVVPELRNDVAQAPQLNTLYLCTIFIPITMFVSVTMLMLSGIYVRAVVRNNEGKTVITHRKVKTIGSILPSLFMVLGALVAFSALWLEHPAAVLIVYLSYFLMFYSHTFTNSKVKFRFWFWLAIIFGLSAISMRIALAIKLPTKTLALGLHAKGQSTIIQWESIFLSAPCLSISMSILSILLRFDYANSLPDDYEPPVLRDTVGFRVPYRRLETFRQTYFVMSFIVLCGSFIGIAALSAAGYVKCTFENVGYFVSFMASPAMVIAALVQATMRGQVGKLWSYEEDWAAIPTVNQEVLVDGDLLEEQSRGSEEKKDEETGLIFLEDE